MIIIIIVLFSSCISKSVNSDLSKKSKALNLNSFEELVNQSILESSVDTININRVLEYRSDFFDKVKENLIESDRDFLLIEEIDYYNDDYYAILILYSFHEISVFKYQTLHRENDQYFKYEKNIDNDRFNFLVFHLGHNIIIEPSKQFEVLDEVTTNTIISKLRNHPSEFYFSEFKNLRESIIKLRQKLGDTISTDNKDEFLRYELLSNINYLIIMSTEF